MIYYIGDKVYPDFGSATIADLLDYFKERDEIGFDTETTGLIVPGSDVLLYQLGDYNNQFVVNAKQYPLELIRSLLEDNSKTFLMHNAAFDLRFLYYCNIIPKQIWDTYLAEAVLYKGNKKMRKSLDVVAYRYCKVTLDKTIRGLIHREGINEKIIKYAADDVKYLNEIKRHQVNVLGKKDLLRSIALENKFVRVLAYVSYCGIYLNQVDWIAKYQEDFTCLMKIKKKLDKYVFNNYPKYANNQLSFEFDDKEPQSTINWSSPLQVSEFFSDIGIDVINDEGKNSVDIRKLKHQSKKFDILPIYIEYKKYEKAVSTYGLEVLKSVNPLTNRIHTSFKQILDTGRISSGDKKSNKSAINLQNIPAEDRTRRCFQAEPGNVLIDADYSGQEQIIFANFTKEPGLINFYRDGRGDMHSYIASQIYPELKNLSLSEIKKNHATKRQNAKAAGFAINYGGNGNTIAGNLNLSEKEGNAIYNGYFEAFPKIKKYFNKVSSEALSKGYIKINDFLNSKCFIFQYFEFIQLSKRVNTPGFWANYRTHKQHDTKEFQNDLLPTVKKYFAFKGEITRNSYNYPIQG